MVYIGVDLTARRARSRRSTERKARPIGGFARGGDAALIDELRPQSLEVAFEATFGWGWFADLLSELGRAWRP